MRRQVTLIVVLALALAASTAQACPVCFSSKEDSRIAFIGTTVLLSALPFMMTTGFVFWYRRRLKQLEEQ